MARPSRSEQVAILRDVADSLVEENYPHVLSLIRLYPMMAVEIRALWQDQADEAWDRELAEDQSDIGSEIADDERDAADAYATLTEEEEAA